MRTIRAWAAVVAAAAVLAACAPVHGTAQKALLYPRDRENYCACRDGDCQVAVSHPALVPVATADGITALLRIRGVGAGTVALTVVQVRIGPGGQRILWLRS